MHYDGRALRDIIIEISQKPFTGLYEFSWMSFRFNIFNFFFVLPYEPDVGLFIVEAFLPVFLTWSVTGLFTGLLVI